MLCEKGSLTSIASLCTTSSILSSQGQRLDCLIWSNFFKPRSSSCLGKASADKLAKEFVKSSVLYDDVLCLRICRRVGMEAKEQVTLELIIGQDTEAT